MKRIRLHIIRCADTANAPSLVLDGRQVEEWFLDATDGLLKLDQINVSSPRRTAECDGGLLDEILRSEIPYPEKRPVDSIALILCRRWRVPPDNGNLTIYGLMFDFKGSDPVLGQFYNGGVPREACAVFLDAFNGLDNDGIAFTAIHELGHVFNLGHDTGGRSFMSARGSTARHFAVGDQQALRLAADSREPYDWNYLPGGADFAEVLPLRAERTVPPLNLRLIARLPKERYLLGEQVVLDLLLEPKGDKSVKVYPGFDPGHPSCRIWYETPLGERYRYRPPLYFCRTSRATVSITKQSPLRHNPRLTIGYKGLNFTTPGLYRIWVEFDIGTNRRPKVVTSNIVEFELVLPRNGTEARISQTLSDPSISYFVAHKGGGLPRTKRRRLEDLAKAYPRQQSVQHVRYALGLYYLKRGRRTEAKAILRGVRPREDSLQQHLGKILEDL